MELSDLVSVDVLSGRLADTGLPRLIVVDVARRSVAEARRLIREGAEADPEALARAELRHIRQMQPQTIVNATGVLLNTNLGRSLLHRDAVAAMAAAGEHYNNTEFDVPTGRRGNRQGYVSQLLTSLTGAEAALVVNNNAAALFLALTALANDLQVIVSRGELIEIGGSFRLPELMGAAGAWLMEVGTTNRTRLPDYEDAIGAETAAIVKVHPSNYVITGFVEEATYSGLADLAHENDLPLIADIGSGLIDDEVPWLEGPPPTWLDGEPAARQSIAVGADLVLFSGDKLLGGPQAGIIVGRSELIRRMSRHPVARAVRCDGTTIAALAATLDLYAAGRAREIPFWAMTSIPYAELAARAEGVLAGSGIDARVVEGTSLVGAGSVPGREIASPVIEIEGDTNARWTGLLAHEPPVLARRAGGFLYLDLRSVLPAEDDVVIAALKRSLS